MSVFKVGDRVVGNHKALDHRVGDTGTVCRVGYGSCFVTSDSDRTKNYFPDYELDLVTEEKPMANFKVGDRVVTVGRTWLHNYVGKTGVVDSLGGYGVGIYVTFDSGIGTKYVLPHEVELIEEKPTVDIHNTEKKPWGEMTPEEKGAILLADHEGKTLDFYSGRLCEWVTIGMEPGHYPSVAYRVKPEPVIETFVIYGSTRNAYGYTRQSSDTHKITYQTVDGEVDCNSVKMEKL